MRSQGKGSARRGRQEPSYHTSPPFDYSDGADCGKLASAYGLSPYPWQQGILDSWLARDARDKYASNRCGLSVPRQNGKNGVLEMRELYGLAIIGEKILHTAHEVRTARKAFLRLCSFFENQRKYPELAALVQTIRKANGQEAIYLVNGASIEFSARTSGAGRGFTVDVIIYDEAQYLNDEQLNATMATCSASPLNNRQLIFTGTPPEPMKDGGVFRRLRDEAHGGLTTDLCWDEWCAEAIGDKMEVERWYLYNPSLGISIEEDWVEKEALTFAPDGFARERLGWWSTQSLDTVMTRAIWDRCATDKPAETGLVVYGVKFSPDGAYVALSVCLRPAEGPPHIELVDYRDMSHGIAWLVSWLTERAEKAAQIVVDGKGQSQTLIDRLRDNGVDKDEIIRPNTAEAITAYSGLLNAVREKAVTHYNQSLLNDSATKTVRRNIGREGGWGFGSVDGADASIVESCALALWQASITTRDPDRRAVVW